MRSNVTIIISMTNDFLKYNWEKICIKYIDIKNIVIVNKIKCAIIKTKTNK